MAVDSRLWDYASESIVSGIEKLHKELETGPDALDQVDTYTDACRSMALQGTVMKKGSEVEGKETLSHWNDLYKNLQNSIPPPRKGESTCPAELLASRHLHLKQLTEKFMKSGTDPAWVKDTIEAIRSDAVIARENAISEMLGDTEALCGKFETNCTYEQSNELFRLSKATEKYADRARKVNGPTVDLINTEMNGESHDKLEHADASQFMGAMSYALRKTKLDSLLVSPTFEHKDLIRGIADSLLTIETATNKILFAHQELGDTKEDRDGDLEGEIRMGGEELWEAESLYKKAVAAEWRYQNSMPTSER
jgi:hypothetical protein